MFVFPVSRQAASIAARASGIFEPITRTLNIVNEPGSTYRICGIVFLRVSSAKSGTTPMTSEGPVVPGLGLKLKRRRFQVTVLPIAWAGDVKPRVRIAVSLMMIDG